MSEHSAHQEDVSFADLIQLREQQQAQIRKALARQNARLKDKLHRSASQGRDSDDSGSSGDENEPSPSAAAPTATPQKTSGASPAAADRSVEGVAAGVDRSVAAGGGEKKHRKHHKNRSNSDHHHEVGGGGGQVSLEAFNELQNVVSSLNQLVNNMNDSQKLAIDSLREHIDTRCNSLDEKLSTVEAAVAVSERTTTLLREEQTMQQLTLAGEIESVRATAESCDKRLDARDEAIQNVQTVVAQLNSTCDNVEERVTAIESFPGAMRAEFSEIEDKFVALSTGVRAERAGIASQSRDIHKAQQEELEQVIGEAREEYSKLHNNAKESVEVVANARDTIAGLIAQGIQEVSGRLETALARRTDDQDGRIANHQQNQLIENHNQNEVINQNVSEMRLAVDSSLTSLRKHYDDAIQEQFKALVDLAEENERRRREAFPVIDADRVAIMLQELQGAQVMIEGIARNTMSVGHRCPLQGRMKELEAKVDDLQAESAVYFGAGGEEEGGSGFRAARNLITFNVPVQTDDMTEDQLSPREKVAAMVERRLAAEMDRAGQEMSDAKMWREVEEAERKGRSQSQQQQQAAPSTSEPPTGRSRSSINPNSGEELRASLKLKQGQLAKVQQVLRTIQEKFHELTLKESKGSAAANGKQLAPEARKVAELIAKQKEAVYQHERQLVDQRNKLLHEIKDLSNREQDLAIN